MQKDKIIYPSPFDYLVDNGEYIVMDKNYTRSVAFIESDSLRIPKNHLAQCLRYRFINNVEQYYNDNREQAEEIDLDLTFLDELTTEILEFFDEEMKHFMQLRDSLIWNNGTDYVDNDIIQSYISYVLKSELYREYLRINYVVQVIPKDEKYYSALRHAIENPEVSDKLLQEHEETSKKSFEHFKKQIEALKEKQKEE